MFKDYSHISGLLTSATGLAQRLPPFCPQEQIKELQKKIHELSCEIGLRNDSNGCMVMRTLNGIPFMQEKIPVTTKGDLNNDLFGKMLLANIFLCLGTDSCILLYLQYKGK